MARVKRKGPRVRLNLEVSPTVKEKLDQLIERSASDSMTEVVRKALAVYELLLDHHLSQGDIVLRLGDGTEKYLTIY